MDWLMILICIVAAAGPVLLANGFGERKAHQQPVPPTLTEIRAEAMTFWNERFYDALEAALPPDACNCDKRRITNACPIHARPPERTYSIRGIHQHIEANRQREDRP